MDRVKLIREYLCGVNDFLFAAEKLLNSHMVSFISENAWENRLPEDIADEITNVSCDDTFKVLYEVGNLKCDVDVANLSDDSLQKLPTLSKFLIRCRQLSLDFLSASPDFEVHFKCKLWDEWGGRILASASKTSSNQKSAQYLTPAKKKHEVEVMSSFVAKYFDLPAVQPLMPCAIVDIGGGKGYLGSALAFQHGIKVLGIDVASNVTSAAKIRNEKLCRKQSEKCSLYQHKTTFVSQETDLGHLVHEVEEDWGDIKSVALVGLHTCGNLSSTCIRLFASKAASDVPVNMLCNVGCCYNLLKEQYIPKWCVDKANNCLPPSLNGCPTDLPPDISPGFPLSNFLCQKKLWLGRNARNLASQSLERVMSQKIIAVESLFQRAVLQKVLLEHAEKCSESVKETLLQKLDKMLEEGKGIGRLAKKNHVLGMHEYLKKAFGKLGLDFELSECDVNELCQNYNHFKSKISIFYLIRMFLAPVVETVILLDRLLYLLEEGISEVFLIKFFDPVISPRCYGLFAVK